MTNFKEELEILLDKYQAHDDPNNECDGEIVEIVIDGVKKYICIPHS